jgi:hypothetical protein
MRDENSSPDAESKPPQTGASALPSGNGCRSEDFAATDSVRRARDCYNFDIVGKPLSAQDI